MCFDSVNGRVVTSTDAGYCAGYPGRLYIDSLKKLPTSEICCWLMNQSKRL